MTNKAHANAPVLGIQGCTLTSTDTIGGSATCNLTADLTKQPLISSNGGDGNFGCKLIDCTQGYRLDADWDTDCVSKLVLNCSGLGLTKTFIPASGSDGINKPFQIKVPCDSSESCTIEIYDDSAVPVIIETLLFNVGCKVCV